jgi:hypothetical protein
MCGVGLYLHIHLSIYPLVVDMYGLFLYLCGVMLDEQWCNA